MNLFTASQQWATRPLDERFWSPEDAYQATCALRSSSREACLPLGQLKAFAHDQEIVLEGPTGIPALPTHHAFGQLCSLGNAPAQYIRRLPTDLAAECLNHTLQQAPAGQRHLLFRTKDDQLRLNALTSSRYDRIWDADIFARLIDLQGKGWRVPPARPAVGDDPRARRATPADCLDASGFGLSVRQGDWIAPAGIYASDHDMFAFMINEAIEIRLPGVDHSLKRGFFISNSEVGARAFRITMFLYNHVCGNHIVWDAHDVRELRVVHLGHDGRAGTKAFEQMHRVLEDYAFKGAASQEALLAQASSKRLGKGPEETVQTLHKQGIAPRKQLESAYQIAQTHPEDGHQGPNTALGMIQGLTRLSQETAYADQREGLDRAAGKILKMAF